MLTAQLFPRLTRKLMASRWGNILRLLGYSRELTIRDLHFLNTLPLGKCLKVTSYITTLGDNHSLSLKSLSLKLVVLLALTRLSRSNDLSNLSLKSSRILPDGVQLNPVCQSKQSRPSRPLKPFTFPSFLQTNGYVQRKLYKHM